MNVEDEIDRMLMSVKTKPIQKQYIPLKRDESPVVNLQGDIATKLRLRQVVDQSAITIPPQGGVGDLPTIFNNMQQVQNQESLTVLTTRESGLCSILAAISDVGQTADPDDLDYFVDRFLYHFYSSRASVKGWRSKQLTQICSGEQQYEKKLEFARIKSRDKEDFV